MALARSSVVCRTLLNRKINTLIKEDCVSCHKFHNGSTLLKNKQNYKEPINITLKSSRPLNENVFDEEPRKKPGKPKQYIVFGDVSVDEETFTKMQEEGSDFEDFDEDDLQNVLQNSDQLYHMYQKEAQAHRRCISNKTLERKVLPRQIEPCLLTWAARDQVKYLHGLDPIQWTPEEVAKHFPISVLGAKKLLRSTFRYATENRIKLLDESVKNNWIKIQKGDVENLDQSLQEKWFSKQLKPSQALPNLSLPLPPPRNPDPSPLLLDDPNKPVGEFYALVKPYVDLTKKAKDLERQRKIGESAGQADSSLIMRHNVKEINDRQPAFMRNDAAQTLSDELGETDEKEYRQKMRRTMHVSHEQFEENMKDYLRNNESKTQEDEQMLAWLENQRFLESGEPDHTSPPEYQDSDTKEHRKVYKKYKEQPDVHYYTSRDDDNSEHEQAYLFSSNTGYQHPMGKSNNTDTIKIDKKLKKEGELYQFGDTFYSEEGEFVFRVFTK